MIIIPPNCPKCDSSAIAPIRQGMSLPFKCTKCDHMFGRDLEEVVKFMKEKT